VKLKLFVISDFFAGAIVPLVLRLSHLTSVSLTRPGRSVKEILG